MLVNNYKQISMLLFTIIYYYFLNKNMKNIRINFGKNIYKWIRLNVNK